MIKGDLALVGLMPRTAEQSGMLAPAWKQLYLSSSAGLITEAAVLYGASASDEQIYSAEVVYSATASPTHDLRLAVAYLVRLLGLRGHEAVRDASA